MANLNTTQDIVNAALRHIGELTDGTSPEESIAQDYVNRMNFSLVSGGSEFKVDLGEDWDWAVAANPKVLILEPALETGTVSLTNSSTAGVFSSAPAASQVGHFLFVENRREIFRIATHVAASPNFTLDANYTDETGATLGFKSVKLDYTLGSSDILRLTRFFTIHRRTDRAGLVPVIERSGFDRRWPIEATLQQIPTAASIRTEDNGTFVARFNKFPEVQTRVECPYIPIPSTLTTSPTTTPSVTISDREVLVYAATYWLMSDRDDSRALNFFRLTQAKLQSMVSKARKTNSLLDTDKGVFFARQSRLDQAVLQTESGIVITR